MDFFILLKLVYKLLQVTYDMVLTLENVLRIQNEHVQLTCSTTKNTKEGLEVFFKNCPFCIFMGPAPRLYLHMQIIANYWWGQSLRVTFRVLNPSYFSSTKLKVKILATVSHFHYISNEKFYQYYM